MVLGVPSRVQNLPLAIDERHHLHRILNSFFPILLEVCGSRGASRTGMFASSLSKSGPKEIYIALFHCSLQHGIPGVAPMEVLVGTRSD